MAKELGLQPGGKLVARLEDGAIVLTPHPKSWLEYITGPPYGVYGRTKEQVDTYMKDVRKGWARRARIAEGTAQIEEDESDTDT